MQVSVKVSGFKGVEDVLATLPKATGKRILRTTGIDALEITAAEMRSRAPREDGELIESITTGTKLSRSQKAYSGFNAGIRNPNMVVVHAGPGTNPQGILQEIGTAHHAAQPFVAPAWEATQNQVLDHVAAELGEAVNKAAARAAKKRARK